MIMSGVISTNVTHAIDLSANTGVIKLSNNRFYQIGSAGALYTNYYDPTKLTLICIGNEFYATDVAHTPLNKRNYNPEYSVLVGNIYNTTNLYDFDGGTITSEHNISIP